jgi:hypothetical protein
MEHDRVDAQTAHKIIQDGNFKALLEWMKKPQNAYTCQGSVAHGLKHYFFGEWQKYYRGDNPHTPRLEQFILESKQVAFIVWWYHNVGADDSLPKGIKEAFELIASLY